MFEVFVKSKRCWGSLAKKKFLFKSLIIIGIVASVCFGQSDQSKKECQVTGVVKNHYNDSVFAGFPVVYSNITVSKFENLSNGEGRYSLDLPPGIYNLTIRFGTGLVPQRRANVRISCNGDQEVNFCLVPWCASGCSDSFRFSEFSDDWTFDKDLNLVILYYGSKKSKSLTTYKSAILTYNNYTVSANKLGLDKKTKTVLADGLVMVDDGKSQKTYAKIVLRFTKDGMQIEPAK